MENLSPPAVSRISFAISEALAAALDDIERSGVLSGVPHPLKPTLRLAFEESIYAIAEHVQDTGDVPREFRFEIVSGGPRGIAAEREMAAINRVLEQAKKRLETQL